MKNAKKFITTVYIKTPRSVSTNKAIARDSRCLDIVNVVGNTLE